MPSTRACCMHHTGQQARVTLEAASCSRAPYTLCTSLCSQLPLCLLSLGMVTCSPSHDQSMVAPLCLTQLAYCTRPAQLVVGAPMPNILIMARS